jgi:hypothetical protein
MTSVRAAAASTSKPSAKSSLSSAAMYAPSAITPAALTRTNYAMRRSPTVSLHAGCANAVIAQAARKKTSEATTAHRNSVQIGCI